MLKFSQLFQTSNESKKRKQAKKLVEKAKVIQQSKKAAVEEKGPLRRSSRGEASIKKSYCEDEVQFLKAHKTTLTSTVRFFSSLCGLFCQDSVICMEEDQAAASRTTLAKSKPQKSLRSLNDVLGKAASVGKETKAVQGGLSHFK